MQKLDNIKLMAGTNKKAELLSIWWFFVLIVIGAGIVGGTYLFSANKVDVRIAQAEILSDRIVGCISDSGFLIKEVLEKDFSILDYCKINKAIFGDSGKYVLKVSFYEKKEIELVSFRDEIIEGNRALITDCDLGNNLNAKNYAKCSKKPIILFNSQGKQVQVNILVASNYEYGV